jgi:hypothetical protein
LSLGFVWYANGTGAGDANTQQQFMQAINPFMSN